MQPMLPLAKKKGLLLHVTTGDHPAYALLDPAAVETLLRQLVSNAIKFTERGEITLEVKAEEEAICLSVCDTGVGIGEAFLPQLFEAFKQESTGAARLHEGSGLGLALAKRLVEAMNGRIVVETERGVGTAFHIYFPYATSERPFASDGKPRTDRLPASSLPARSSSAPHAPTRRPAGAASQSF